MRMLNYIIKKSLAIFDLTRDFLVILIPILLRLRNSIKSKKTQVYANVSK